MVLKTIGQKISRLGDVVQQPRLLKVRFEGIEVRMFEALNKPWLLKAGIRTVFDVGANTGQFAKAIHEILPEAFIYSFEPLRDCFVQLKKSMSDVGNFQGFNTALADSSGESAFYRSKWSPSSSLLKMARLHKDNFPFSEDCSAEVAQVRTLDECTKAMKIENEILVKLDVQGSEDKVIAGGKLLLQRAKVLIVETSMSTLYEGQPLFSDILKLLENQGYIYRGNISQLLSPLDQSVLQANSIFMRED